MNRRSALMFSGLVLVVAAMIQTGCRRVDDTANMIELQRVRSGMMDIVLLSPHDALRHGKDAFVIEFRSTSGRKLVDVGTVRVSANMPMPGMAMFGTIEARPTSVPGRYAANSEFGMAGTWRMKIEWDNPDSRGSVSFAETVQ